MYVDDSNIWYVSGFPVSFHMILEWWEKYCLNTPKNKRYIGDPHFSDKICKQISAIIVQEMQSKVSGHALFGSPYTTSETTGNIQIQAHNTVSTWLNGDDPETAGVDWHDQDIVLKTALETAERQWKERQAADRKAQQERANFWQNQKKNTHIQPPKPIPVFNWRAVLGFTAFDIITEESIKKKYRKEAMKRHPDRGGTSELINELFKARDDAYRFIGKDLP